jgi:ketosteroid isomerase-like protein
MATLQAESLFGVLAAGNAAGASAAFADDAVYAYWDGTGDETAERTVATGREAIGLALAGNCLLRPEPRVALQEDRNCFVEGALVAASGRAAGTFAASAQLDDAGRVARCLVFSCPPVKPSATWATPAPSEPADALTILERYFRHLDAGELVEACECFSEDCLYSHPPYRPGSPRVEFRGRDELLEGFRTTRGPRRRPSSHPIVCSVQRGADAFIEGVADNEAGRKGSFVSSAALDGDGLIRRYVAFYTSSRIPRR